MWAQACRLCGYAIGSSVVQPLCLSASLTRHLRSRSVRRSGAGRRPGAVAARRAARRCARCALSAAAAATASLPTKTAAAGGRPVARPGSGGPREPHVPPPPPRGVAETSAAGHLTTTAAPTPAHAATRDMAASSRCRELLRPPPRRVGWSRPPLERCRRSMLRGRPSLEGQTV